MQIEHLFPRAVPKKNLGLERNLWLTDFRLLRDCFHLACPCQPLWVSLLPPQGLLFSLPAGSSFSFHLFNFGLHGPQLLVFFTYIYPRGDLFQAHALNIIYVATAPKFMPPAQNPSKFLTYPSNWHTTAVSTSKHELPVIPSKPAPLGFLVSERSL